MCRMGCISVSDDRDMVIAKKRNKFGPVIFVVSASKSEVLVAAITNFEMTITSLKNQTHQPRYNVLLRGR